MALAEPLHIRSTLLKKVMEGKATSTLEALLGPTHQDCSHDADVFGILPAYAAMGDFCKVCQSAKEHQKAQHLNQRSDLQTRGRSPNSQQQCQPPTQTRQSVEIFQWVLLLSVLQVHKSGTKQQFQVKFPATHRLKTVNLYLHRIQGEHSLQAC